MKKYLIAALAAALWCIPAWGQNSATGNISASSTNCFSVASSCVWESPLPPNAGTSTVAISGTFSATLLVEESNDGGKTWATAATLSAVGTTTYSTNGFSDIRVRCSAYTSGTAVVTISTGLLQVQSVVSSASSSGAAPCVGAGCINVASSTYGGFYDTQIVIDATWNSGVGTVTSPTAHFLTTAAVNMTIWGLTQCNPAIASGTQLATLGAASNTLITAVVSDTQVNFAGSLPTSSIAGTGCIAYGFLDDTGLANAWTAGNALSVCPTFGLPAAYGMISTPPSILWDQPNGCKRLPQFVAGIAAWANGMSVRGSNKGVSQLFMVPWWNMTPCTHGVSTISCFVVQQQALWEDFSLNGLMNTRAGSTSNHVLVESAGYARLHNVGFIDFGAADGNLDGMLNNCASGCNLGGPILLDEVTIQGWGTRSFHNQTGGMWMRSSAFQTSTALDGSSILIDGGEVVSEGGNFFMGNSITGQSYVRINGGKLWLQADDKAIADISTAANYGVRVAGGVAYLNGVNLHSDGNAGSIGLFLSAGGQTYLSNSILGGDGTGSAGTGVSIFTNAGTNLFDLGGNTLGGSVASTFNGNLFGNASISGTALTVGAVVASANWGTGAAVSAPFGATTDVSFTLTNGSAAVGANPTLTYTFPKAFWVRPNYCTITQTGGTQAGIANEWSVGTPTTTSVVFTYNGTPTINLTEFLAVSCH